VFQQIIGIPIGTVCVPLLHDFFHGIKIEIRIIVLNSGFRYIDDVLSLNNSRFSNYLHLLYPNQLEVKDTTDTQMSASYLDLGIDNGGILKSKLYDT